MSDEEIQALMGKYEPFIMNDEGDVDMRALMLLSVKRSSAKPEAIAAR